MNIISHSHHKENKQIKQINWSAIILFALGFWLSGSLLLDFVLIPSLATTGMMAQSGFASAGFTIFGVFNRIELICASLVLTCAFVFSFNHDLDDKKQKSFIIFSSLLFLIALAYTYLFTPHLSAWGLCLNQFNTIETMPSAMILWHKSYWILETVKYGLGITLLRWSYQNK
ncbi:hypothetical protein GM3708_3067 [Geminocystis sp. NIES-3708]|uniref:hypothetical protein n=1 Tax=Geminocystis sp. NIES-3708 TaxID=1615909 RepID=UPI0005FC6FB1|nr:hypothetical protein [Geminocystis sp. NIES-3708]BAQ62661.1 hypothetical protein GM3708_3067 [Geminocystis sp. NIES-3708]